MVAAVTATNFVITSDLVIQFDVELPAWVSINNDLAPVWVGKDGARYVGERIQIQNRLPDGIDPVWRNNVVHPTERESVSGIRWTRRGSLVSRTRIVDSI